ncbi:MAG: zinc dependent phospholipase C family protein [Christensenellaceae bacterium]
MPAILTHIITADKVLEKIENPRMKKIITENIDAYYSGSQGGDYFYLYKYYSVWVGTRMKLFGWALHYARTQKFFCECAKYIKQNENDKMLAYLYGYITHYCLDKLLHPYVNADSHSIKTHNYIEYDLDVMVANRAGIDAKNYDKEKFVLDSLVTTGEIDTLLKAVAKKVYPRFKLSKTPYQTAYRYHAKFNKKLINPTKGQIAWIKFRGMFMALDLISMLYKDVDEIKDAHDYGKYFYLIDKSIKESLRLMSLCDSYIFEGQHISVLQSAIPHISFHGKTIVPMEERKAFKKAYRRAPIVHVKMRGEQSPLSDFGDAAKEVLTNAVSTVSSEDSQKSKKGAISGSQQR